MIHEKMIENREDKFAASCEVWTKQANPMNIKADNHRSPDLQMITGSLENFERATMQSQNIKGSVSRKIWSYSFGHPKTHWRLNPALKSKAKTGTIFSNTTSTIGDQEIPERLIKYRICRYSNPTQAMLVAHSGRKLCNTVMNAADRKTIMNGYSPCSTFEGHCLHCPCQSK